MPNTLFAKLFSFPFTIINTGTLNIQTLTKNILKQRNMNTSARHYRDCCSDLVNAEVCHPKNNGAGHELGFWSWRRAEGGAGGTGAYLTCGESSKQAKKITEKRKYDKHRGGLFN